MKYAILVLLVLLVSSTVFASESNLTLANRTTAINALMADNAIISAGATTLQATTGSATVKVTAIMQTITPLIMAWLDTRFTYDKVVKKTVEGNVTYWHKVSQLRLQTESTQIDVAGQTNLKAELTALKANITADYNAKINAIQAQIDAIPNAVEDRGGD